MAGGPALQTAEMRLPGGAGSSLTYSAHLQVCHICSGCCARYMRGCSRPLLCVPQRV